MRRPARRRGGDPAGRLRWSIPGLADSKLLTAKARERCYGQVAAARGRLVGGRGRVGRVRPARHARGERRGSSARARSARGPPALRPDRRLPGRRSGVPGLAVWKGDRVAACIAAASVVAKVTRDRIMMRAARAASRSTTSTIHKGYCTEGASAGARRARALPRAPPPLRQRPAGRRHGGSRDGQIRADWLLDDDPDRLPTQPGMST